MNDELTFMEMKDALEKAKWKYCGGGWWIDSQTQTKFQTSVAYKVMLQRAVRIKHLKSLSKPLPTNLIHASNWKQLTKEIRRQLKSHGLTLKLRTKRDWCGSVVVEVAKLPPPKPVKCPDCGLMSDDNRCCYNTDIWQ